MTVPDLFMVQNYEIWGTLVQSWATGNNYFNDGKSYAPNFTKIADFTATLDSVGAGAVVPARYQTVQFVQSSETNLVIRLPEKRLLLEAIQDLAQPGTIWTLPSFYITEFGAHNVDPSLPPDQKEQLFAMRVGDYTVGNCLGQ
jgi:hypothetical protein